MNYSFALSFFLGVAVLSLGLSMQAGKVSAEDDFWEDSDCAVMLEPKDCSAGGHTFCFRVLELPDEECEGTTCRFCPGDTTLPDAVCYAKEGFRCFFDPILDEGFPACRNTDPMQGSCLEDEDDCDCANPFFIQDEEWNCDNSFAQPCIP